MIKINIAEIPTNPEARREWIKYQLRLRGWTLSSLSKSKGYSRYCAIQAMHTHYPKWERIIASTLGLQPEDIWPERYEKSTQVNGNKETVAGQRKTTEAA